MPVLVVEVQRKTGLRWRGDEPLVPDVGAAQAPPDAKGGGAAASTFPPYPQRVPSRSSGSPSARPRHGQEVPHRAPVREFECPVWTVFGPELRRTIRKTTVALYEPQADEAAMVYEMGTRLHRDRWHVGLLRPSGWFEDNG
jgi:hypothetical protein